MVWIALHIYGFSNPRAVRLLEESSIVVVLILSRPDLVEALSFAKKE